MEGGDDDGHSEGEPEGDVDGRTGTQEPVAGEGVVEGREAEEEDAEQGEAGGDEDEGERPPVVPGGSLPRLVVCQLVQSEDGPEECEAGDEDDVRERIQESDVGVRVVGHYHLAGNIVYNLK